MSPLVVLFVCGVPLAGVCGRHVSNDSIVAVNSGRASAAKHVSDEGGVGIEAINGVVSRGHGAAPDGQSGGGAGPPRTRSSDASGEARTLNNASAVGKESAASEKPTQAEVWGFGLVFVTIINFSAVLGVVFLPLMNKRFYKKLLTVMIGLAVGSLSASSVFHLIPQAFSLTDDPHHRYLNVSLMVWGGIWVFFLVERVLRILASAKHGALTMVPAKDSSDTSTPTTDDFSEGEDFEPRHGHSHGPQVHFQQGKDSVIGTVAWMVVFGDGFHNFIDGLSIGAAFNQSVLTGVSISVAVLCEELPHELGDFAVLLAAGMTMRQALVYNFLSACTCYLGLVVGIFLGEFDASVYVFGFAAGMFMYISLVDMMPEMNAAAEDAAKRGKRHAAKMLLLQNIGLLSGVALLFSLAKFQDNIAFW